jgi:hypothetical protein
LTRGNFVRAVKVLILRALDHKTLSITMVLDACSKTPKLSHLDLSSNGVSGDGRSL